MASEGSLDDHICGVQEVPPAWSSASMRSDGLQPPLTQESPRDGLCKSAGDSPEVHQPIRSTPSIDVNLSQLHTVRAKASFEVFGAKRQIDFSVAFVTPMSDQLGEEQLARRMFRFQNVHR